MTSQTIIYNYINNLKNDNNFNINSIIDNFDDIYFNDIKHILKVEFNIEIDENDIEIKTKRNDNKYKKDIKKIFNNKCVITGYDIARCEIAHIEAFHTCSYNEKYDKYNGLILDSSLHKLYDIYEFTIEPKTFKIIVRNRENDILRIDKYNDIILNLKQENNIFLEYHYLKFLEKNN
jgi:hypothetical protein